MVVENHSSKPNSYLFINILLEFGQPVARFKHHSAPITSVEWHPQDTTTFMASGEDDQTSIWDIATENDDGEAIEGIPPQLMFLHLGQKEVRHFISPNHLPIIGQRSSLASSNPWVGDKYCDGRFQCF